MPDVDYVTALIPVLDDTAPDPQVFLDLLDEYRESKEAARLAVALDLEESPTTDDLADFLVTGVHHG